MVEVVGYDPAWRDRFELLRRAYAEALDSAGAVYIAIEHVGSTSVPGLVAKPVIDIDIVVEPAEIATATAALETLGMTARGDLGVEGRYAFTAPSTFAPTNTYLAVSDSLALRNHLAVRDVLRADRALRDEYAVVKLAAAAAASDIDDYILRKSAVLDRILRRAGLSDDERAQILATNLRITGRGARG